MKKKVLTLLSALVLLFSLTITAAAQEKVEPGTIVILHTNDVHGAIDGYAKVSSLKAAYEAAGADVLLFDAGDFIQGDPTVSVSQGKTAVELMNMAGYDAATIGNHEFDYGYANFQEIAKDARFPIISANVKVNGKVENAHAVFTTSSGIRIGVFGLTTPETATKAHPAKIQGVTFAGGQEMFDIAWNEVYELKTMEGCDYVICLGHLGIDDESAGNRSIDVLANVPGGIDAFIDGHSHSTLEEEEEAGPTYKSVLTSTGTKLANIGVVTITPDGQVITAAVSTEGLTEDAAITERAAAIQKQIDADYGREFAKTEVELNGAKDPGNRTEETNLGDLITDSLVWGAEKNGVSVDAAITNGGGIRATIKQGAITKKDVNTVLPFGNTLSIVKVTGAELLEALEASTFCSPVAVGGFPQVSGITFTVNTAAAFDEGGAYPGSTYHKPASINRVTIKTVGGVPFDVNAVYAIATNDFMAAGGDTYYAFSAASVNYDLGVPMDEVLMDYIKEELKGNITAADYGAPAGRIAIAQGDAATPAPFLESMTAAGSYTVKSGDCLWNIAKDIYGDGAKWQVIYHANAAVLRDPNVLKTGQVLETPAA